MPRPRIRSFFASAEMRPIALRMRRDLKVVAVAYRGEDAFVAKDPLALRYYRLRPDEHFVLNALDGSVTLGALRDAYQRTFATRRITLAQLQSLLVRFHQYGLVVADAAGQGVSLQVRHRKEKCAFRRRAIGNLLAIRFPGVDPDRMLSRFYPWVRPLFSKSLVAVSLGVSLFVLLHFLANFRTFAQQMPAMDAFLSAENLLLTMAVLSGTKVLHELGHAFACKHFGGECHKIGFMLLVFTPALYCDTSDSWLLPNKWHRAAVGAAGMYVEILLATVAAIIGWNVEPGWLQTVAMQVMFVCSVSTVLFNANPLLRYDGYFILSDLANVPNLANRAQSLLWSVGRRWFLGHPVMAEPTLSTRERWGMTVYAIAAMLYRWLLVGVILFYLLRMFEPHGIRSLGVLLVGLSLVGMAIPMVASSLRSLRRPTRSSRLPFGRWLVNGCWITSLAGLVGVPLPQSIQCPALIRPQEQKSVYVTVPGTVEEILVQPDQQVLADQPLLKLSNPKLELDLIQIQGRYNAQALLVSSLKQRRTSSPDAADQLPSAETVLEDLNTQLSKKAQQLKSLSILSPVTGRVVSPPKIPRSKDESELPNWSERPLDQGNRGSYLEAGVAVCYVTSSNRWLAELLIEQADREWASLGQNVELMLDAYPGHRWTGIVKEVAQRKLDSVPLELSVDAGGMVPSQIHGTDAEPLRTYYQALVEMDATELSLVNGLRGCAKIEVRNESLWARGRRTLGRLLRF